MATYTYNGKVLVKNSRRENYKYACINKNTFKKVQISSTREGASVELNNWISASEQYIENCGRALKAIEEGKTTYVYRLGRKFFRREVTFYKNRKEYYWMDEEERSLDPKTYFETKREKEIKHLEEIKNTYIIVEVEKA